MMRAGWLLISWIICGLLIAGCSSDEPQRLRIGDQAPPFAITDLDGAQISSDTWRGHPVILRFWDTECKYCRADTPIINSYFDRYQQRGLKVLYIATGNETVERVENFISALDITFPVALDADHRMATDYQVRIVPQTIFISPEQEIITAVLGGLGKAELDELLGDYLQP